MRNLFAFVVLAVLFIGCEPRDQGKNTTPTKPVATPAESNGGNTAIPTPEAIKGERVEKETLIKFEPSKLPDGWTFVDPDGKDVPSATSTKDGVFELTIPAGKDLYGETRTAPRLLRAVSGDFQIETRVKFDPKDSYQGAGLLVFHNDVNYLRLERGFGGVGGGDSGIRLDARSDDKYEPLTTPADVATDATTVDLKIIRVGSQLTAFWRMDENLEWKEVGEFQTNYPDTVRVGLIGCNTGKGDRRGICLYQNIARNKIISDCNFFRVESFKKAKGDDLYE